VEAGLLRAGDRTKLAIVFGLRRSRGDNKVFATQKSVTPVFSDILRRLNFSLLTDSGDMTPDPVGYEESMGDKGIQVNLIGLSRNIRDSLPAESYKNLVTELADASGS